MFTYQVDINFGGVILRGGRVMVLNTTFNNISVISWRSVLLVEYPEKTTDLPQNTDPVSNFAIYALRQKVKSHPVYF